jgi:hypothetical protein
MAGQGGRSPGRRPVANGETATIDVLGLIGAAPKDDTPGRRESGDRVWEISSGAWTAGRQRFSLLASVAAVAGLAGGVTAACCTGAALAAGFLNW